MRKILEKPTCIPKRNREDTIPTENPRIVMVKVKAEELARKIKKQGGLK
jgi:hypothetical protein